MIITYVRVMDKDYECKRVKVTCPVCGAKPAITKDGYSICHAPDVEGYPCNEIWNALTSPYCCEFSMPDEVRLKIGDDSRLYRNERWLLVRRGDPFYRIYFDVKEFRETGIVPPFPGMVIDAEYEKTEE